MGGMNNCPGMFPLSSRHVLRTGWTHFGLRVASHSCLKKQYVVDVTSIFLINRFSMRFVKNSWQAHSDQLRNVLFSERASVSSCFRIWIVSLILSVFIKICQMHVFPLLVRSSPGCWFSDGVSVIFKCVYIGEMILGINRIGTELTCSSSIERDFVCWIFQKISIFTKKESHSVYHIRLHVKQTIVLILNISFSFLSISCRNFWYPSQSHPFLFCSLQFNLFKQKKEVEASFRPTWTKFKAEGLWFSEQIWR